MKKRSKAKIEKRMALFKSQTKHREIGQTIRLSASRHSALIHTHQGLQEKGQR
ncbi:hypothetical protein FIU87_06110 [Bacillus sp. THAF10]|uniref:hypothetical protein n=1 Tax=Bacillus sp. THAF10 TaxID=2587848 RepID=UPI0012A8562B|nr:hypothetical protein [Bacillus sp. THAF10]QFT88208.1 hypothetical protein FIU87_06110 [Bacillus sp. THAF10]